jgi:predicted amidohydrolase
MFANIDEAAAKGANIIVLPGQALQGYLVSLVNLDLDELDYQYENAETVPNGESVHKIINKAKEKNIYVVFGVTERDSNCHHMLYNTIVLTGSDMDTLENIGRYISLQMNFMYTIMEMSSRFSIQKLVK